MNKVTPVSLEYRLSVFNKTSTLKHHSQMLFASVNLLSKIHQKVAHLTRTLVKFLKTFTLLYSSYELVSVVRNTEYILGKTGVTADRDKIEFRLFNSSSIFNITLREELFSLPKKNQTCCLVLVSWC